MAQVAQQLPHAAARPGRRRRDPQPEALPQLRQLPPPRRRLQHEGIQEDQPGPLHSLLIPRGMNLIKFWVPF